MKQNSNPAHFVVIQGGRPPPNEDSTPHETLADQVVRLRQLISGKINQVRYIIIIRELPSSNAYY